MFKILKSCFKSNAGYLFSLNHARLVVLMATIYAIYCVKVQVGWHGVILSINLAFFSNDALNYMLQWCDNVSESTHFEEQKQSEEVIEDDFSGECEYSIPTEESEKVHSCKSSSKPVTSTVIDDPKESSPSTVAKEEINSAVEMKKILDSIDHYEALGFPRHKKIDAAILKKEYRKKVDITFHFFLEGLNSPVGVLSFFRILSTTFEMIYLRERCFIGI